VSIGVADASGCRNLEGLLARADLALYEAKRAGRACYRTFEETGVQVGERSAVSEVPSPARR